MEAAADLSAAALALQVDLLQLPPEIPAPGAPALRGVLDRLFAHWLSLPDTASSSSPPPLRIRRDPNPSLVELAAGPVEVADEAYEFRAPKYFDFVNDETEERSAPPSAGSRPSSATPPRRLPPGSRSRGWRSRSTASATSRTRSRPQRKLEEELDGWLREAGLTKSPDVRAVIATPLLELVDAAVDPSLLEPIKETILKVDGVKGCHRLRGRKTGTSLYLDVHIEVYPFLSVSAAHDIGETVRHHIQKTHNQVAEVFIHIDPSYSVGSNMDQKRILENSERRNSDVIPRQHSAEAIVSDIISSHFSKKMSLEYLMLHYLQGRVLLLVQVSMSPEILIRDAMDIAKQVEEEILKADASISQVSVQLRLGQQIQQLQLAASKSGANDLQAETQ